MSSEEIFINNNLNKIIDDGNYLKVIDATYTTAIVFFSLFLFLMYMLIVSNINDKKQFQLGLKLMISAGVILALSGLVLSIISLYEPKSVDNESQYYIDKVADYVNMIFVLLVFFGVVIFVLYKMFTKKVLKCVDQNNNFHSDRHVLSTVVFLIITAFTYLFLRIFAMK